jgi:hypothetical protein
MKPTEILPLLERAHGGLPKEALRAALTQREVLEPHLMEALRDSPRQLRSRGPDWTLHTFALYLTATWGTPEALPLVVDFFAWPGTEPGELTGDFVTEHLARVLASVAHGRLDTIKRLAVDAEIDEYTRAAAIDAAVIMRLHGQLPEGAAEAWLGELATSDLDDDSGVVWGELALACARLRVVAARDDVERAFRLGLIDEKDIRLDEFLDELAEPGSVVDLEPPEWAIRLIDDPVDLLSRFDWEPDTPNEPDAPRPLSPGRNDPCPCGSGLKFKRCCLRTQEDNRPRAETAAERRDRLGNEIRVLLETADAERRQAHLEATCDALQAAWQLSVAGLPWGLADLAAADAPLPEGMNFLDLTLECLTALTRAGRQNQRYARIGVGFCDTIEQRFPDAFEAERLDEIVACTYGELLIQSGEPLHGERVLLDLIEERPHRAAAYATLASALGQDQFAWHKGRPLDVARAVEILEEALAAEVEDAAEYDLEKRLEVMRASLPDGNQGGYGVR